MLRILGDSHVIAFRDGLKTADTFLSGSLEGAFGGAQAGMLATAGILRSPFSAVRGNTIEFTDKGMSDRLNLLFGLTSLGAEVREEPLVVSAGFHFVNTYKSNYLGQYSLIPHPRKHFISSGVFEDFVLRERTETFRFAKLLIDAGFNAIFVESPPVRRVVLDLPKVRMGVDELLEIDRQYRSVMRRHLHGVGARVIAIPEAIGSDGFLKREYENENDNHHGNSRYGQLGLRYMLDIADALKTREASLP